MNEITLNNSDLSHEYEGKDPDGDFESSGLACKDDRGSNKNMSLPLSKLSSPLLYLDYINS